MAGTVGLWQVGEPAAEALPEPPPAAGALTHAATGLRIDAQCSGSREILSYRKYMKLDLAVSHRGRPRNVPKAIFRADISPTGWVVVKETKPFCKKPIIRDEF